MESICFILYVQWKENGQTLPSSSNDFIQCITLKVKIFVQWPFGDQLFGFSHQGKFLGAKLY